MNSRLIDSPIGPITLIAEEGAIVGLYFGDTFSDSSQKKLQGDENASQNASNESIANESKANDNVLNENVLTQCEKELDDYFARKLREFTVPIRAVGTPFRERVWEALLQIPYGETVSYRDIAVKVGNPKAVRAVGGANHNNPISIIVPCHRVIGTNGSLTGYGGGMDAKKWLLELEEKYENGTL